MRVVAGLAVSVLALVGEQDVDQPAQPILLEDPIAVSLEPGAGHVVEEGPVAVGLALGERNPPGQVLELRLARILLMGARLAVGVVVLDLVVVPDREEGMGGVHRLQVRVGLVEAVLLPVLAEQLRVPVVIDPCGVVANAGIGVLVDVVAEAEDQVEVLLVRDRPLGVVEARVPVLARVEGDPDRLARVQRRRGLEPADRRLRVLGDEAVEVVLVGLQAVDEGAGREVTILAGGDRLLRDDVAELPVGGDNDVQLGRPLDLAETGPELDALGSGKTGGDALLEGGLLHLRNAAVAGQGGIVHGRGHGRPGRQGTDQEAAPAEPV